MNIKCFCVLALVVSGVCNALSQGIVVIPFATYSAAQGSTNYVWGAAQYATTPGRIAVSPIPGDPNAFTTLSWGALNTWNIQITYDAGTQTLSTSASNTAAGGVQQSYQIGFNGGSIAALMFSISARNGSVTLENMALNGSPVAGGSSISYSGGFFGGGGCLSLLVPSGNFSSLSYNLTYSAIDPGQMVNVLALSPQFAVTPEPSTFALAILGGASLLLYRRRK
jgi:hypothetical protein